MDCSSFKPVNGEVHLCTYIRVYLPLCMLVLVPLCKLMVLVFGHECVLAGV